MTFVRVYTAHPHSVVGAVTPHPDYGVRRPVEVSFADRLAKIMFGCRVRAVVQVGNTTARRTGKKYCIWFLKLKTAL